MDKLSDHAIKCGKFINKNKQIDSFMVSHHTTNFINNLSDIMKKSDKKYLYRQISVKQIDGTKKTQMGGSVSHPTCQIVAKQTGGSLNDLIDGNPFIPQEIINETNGSLYYYKYESIVDNFKINIHFYTSRKLEPNVNEILKICHYVRNVVAKNKNVKLELNILDSMERKQIYEEDKFLTPRNINSGSCISFVFVNMWRREEFSKVLIHELMHFFRIDFGTYPELSKKIDGYIKDRYNTNTITKISETYTELLAIILHSVYVAYSLNLSAKGVLFYEINFSLFQVGKILNFVGIDNVKNLGEYFKKTEEKTAVFAYFIVKTAILLKLDQFIEFVGDIYEFDNRTDKFIDLIKLSLDNNQFYDLIDKNMKLVADDTFMKNTLRMSCIEHDIFNHQKTQ